MDDVEEFLAHYGVKGMKWGEHKARPTSTRTPRQAMSAEKKQHAKYVGKELAFGSIGPAALLMGAGPPLSIALGISVSVLRSPPVANAIKQSSKASADLMKEIGETKLAAMKAAKVEKEKLKDRAKSVPKKAVDQAINTLPESAMLI